MPYKKRKTGRCCSGALCKHPKHELSPEHTCPKCNLIVHALCGVFDNHLDMYCCQPCVDKKYTPLPLVPPVDPPVDSSPAATPCVAVLPKERRTKVCASCGGTDHMRKNSKKCPHYKERNPPRPITRKNLPRSVTTTNSRSTNLLDALAGVAATVGAASLVGAVTAGLDALATAATTGVAATVGVAATADVDADDNVDDDANDDDDADTIASINLSTTNFIQVPNEGNTKRKRTKLNYTPVVDVGSGTFKERDTVFKVYNKEVRGSRTRLEETPPTPAVLVDQFWPLPLVKKMVLSSNQYHSLRQLQHPSLYIWTQKLQSAPFTVSSMYQFIAILYYFGVV